MKLPHRLFSRILTIAAVIFFVVFVWRQFQDLESPAWSEIRWGLLLASVLIYISNAFLFPIAWRTLLSFTGNDLSPSAATAIFFESQFAKYVPGNVAQHLGRVLLSKRAGLPSAAAALTIAVEAAWVAAIGIVLALLSGAAGATSQGFLSAGFSYPVLALFVLGALFLPLFLTRLAGPLIKKIPQLRAVRVPPFQPTLSGTIICVLIYAINLLVFGLITWIIAIAIGTPMVPVLPVMTYAIASWVAGFLTPGSPAGAGIRDSVLVLGLATIIPGPEAALVAILHRLITGLGDSILFIIGKGLASSRLCRPDPAGS